MAQIQIREALRQAMAEEMRKDPAIFLMGEEVAQYNGAYKVSQGMLEEFGPDRVVDTPIAEGGFAGLGIGAAMVGMRPIIEFMTWNFSFVGFDQLDQQRREDLPDVRRRVPDPDRVPRPQRHGARTSVRSTRPRPTRIYAQLPGPEGRHLLATPYDAKGLLKSAIRDDNPVVFLESRDDATA